MRPRWQWQRLLRRHRQRTQRQWLDYQAQGGHPDLKASIADYVRLSRAMWRCYRQRQAALRRALAPAVAAGLPLSERWAGMHLVAGLESRDLEQALVHQALTADVSLAPLSPYFIGDNPEPGLVLGYAGCETDEIARAGRRLCWVWLTKSNVFL